MIICAILLCMPHIALAKRYIISPLPLPSQEVLNLNTQKCSSSCLLNYFARGELFSFIANFHTNTTDNELRAKFYSALSDLGISATLPLVAQSMQSGAKIKLAVLMPKKIIGRYSTSSIDTILAYLVARGADFSFEVFDSIDESEANLSKTYEAITKADYEVVIAILTPKGAQQFSKLSISRPTYLPTVHKKQIGTNTPKNLIFGGIDYEAQIELLLALSGGKNIIAYNDSSAVGKNLGAILKQKSDRVVLEEVVDSKLASTFIQKLEKQKGLMANSIVFFNTPVVKTGLMASQIGLIKKPPEKLLSTQINFNPSLLLLVQKGDRQNLFIANVINNQSKELVEYAALLGGDLRYDWVNYATAIGVEQLLSSHIASGHLYFKERIKDNQVDYTNKLYKSDAKGFYEY